MNVLLAIDGPLYGKQIEEFVVNHNWPAGTKLKLMHAVNPLEGMEAFPEIVVNVDREKELLAEMSLRIQKALSNVDVLVEIHNGFAKEEIIAEALGWPADMIVLGSHGRKGLQRFLMGSVSSAVVMHAPCSVVTIRLPQSVQEESTNAIANLLVNQKKSARDS